MKAWWCSVGYPGIFHLMEGKGRDAVPACRFKGKTTMTFPRGGTYCLSCVRIVNKRRRNAELADDPTD